ncbi:hypothetical protein GS399_12950 [Pedobacter sp. HMF7647]|uniref:Uncharacterized protein n=1 Tax=Hufsiella arboris TaxID=2695275 RepID=A0A7K1YBD4_9SPHI|nr:hypothetical protein [Hufsiella arboris]MXV51886.1 hypothetical protein [Hufsiella arboris]
MLIEQRKASAQHIIPLRLQAYERAILFIERINPSNMLLRLHVAGLSAAEMQKLILAEIRTEFQHNVTQQLYISESSWAVLKKIKDDTIILINGSFAQMNSDSNAGDFSRTILNKLASADNVYDAALHLIKKDISELF